MKTLNLRRWGVHLLVMLMTLAVAAPGFAEGKKAKAWRPWNGNIPPAPEHVDVKKGDSLSGYAGKYLWPLIWIMNKDTVENPHLIHPGQRVLMPANDGLVGGHQKAVQSYAPPIGEVMFSTPGEVRYHRTNGDEMSLYAGDPIYGPGTLHTDSGAALVKLSDGTTLKVYDHSQVSLNEAVKNKEKKSSYQLIDQKQGKVLYKLPKYPDPSYKVEVKTPVATVDPKSRQFQIDTQPGEDIRISSFDGKLRVIGRSRFVDIPVDHGVAISPDGKRMAETRLPDAPIVKAPRGVTSPNVIFVWTEVKQADRYSIQIGADREITDLVFIGTIFDGTSFPMDIRNAGDYYWNVEAVNKLGFSSSPQVPMRFTVSDQFVGID